jgi:hypothetical protein
MKQIPLSQIGSGGATAGQTPIWDPTTGRWKVGTPTETSLYDAKGDLLVGSGDNTRGRLGVGTDGQVPTADSTVPLGISYKNVVHAIGAGTGITVDSSNPLAPVITNSQALPAGGSQANVLTMLSGGVDIWMGNVVVLIPHGGAVPGGTPVGAIIVEKA